MPSADGATYKQIQGLSRGLSVLRALNRAEGGWATIPELTASTSLHRATVRRMLETLQAEGLVRRSVSDDSYRLTIDVRTLSEGFTDDEWISQAATPVLGELLHKVIWPSDLTTLDGLTMRVRETTHRFSPLSFHTMMVRRRLPLATTASGRAYLAFCPEAERQGLFDQLAAAADKPFESVGGRAGLAKLVATCRERGYGFNLGEWDLERKIMAIAVPVFHKEKVAGCINVVLLKSAMSIDVARQRYLPALREAATKVQRYLEG
jgi:IclR family mhp operon transcriptional activator